MKLGMPPVSALAFSTLPRWARRMYGRPGRPLSEAAATAGLRAARLIFGQQWLFSGATRAVHRAESAAETGLIVTAARQELAGRSVCVNP
jgi:hypothetical protein